MIISWQARMTASTRARAEARDVKRDIKGAGSFGWR
jgi:hypothetical protein